MKVLSEWFSAGKEHIYSSSCLFITAQLYSFLSAEEVDAASIHGSVSNGQPTVGKIYQKKGQIKDWRTPWTTDSEIILQKHL